MRMLRWTSTAGTFVLALCLSQPVSAQSLTLAPKLGSTGIGADVALRLTDKLAIKGGIGLIPFTWEGEFEENDFTVEPPPVYVTAALDVALVGKLRAMAGLLYRSDDFRVDAEVTDGLVLNEQEYTQSGVIEGAVTSASFAPFLGLGFGAVVGPGVGLYVDAGVAFIGDPGVELSATGEVTQVPGFLDDLEAEEAILADDIGGYYRYWPILNVGLRIGLGN